MIKIKKISRERKIIILILFLFILSLSVFLSILFIRSQVILEKKELDVFLIIGERTGFDLNTSAIVFGRVPIGGSALRKITIENNYGFPIVAEFSVTGDVKKFVNYEPLLKLQPGEVRNVAISTITIPEGSEFGNYTGKMNIVFKRNVWD